MIFQSLHPLILDFFLVSGGGGVRKFVRLQFPLKFRSLDLFQNPTRLLSEVLKSSVMRGATAPLWGKDSTADSMVAHHEGPQDASARGQIAMTG